MKRFALIALLLIAGCSLGGIVDVGSPKKFAVVECHPVTAKVMVVGTGNDIQFHLVAGDGSYVRVDESEFYAAPVDGPCFPSTSWQKGATTQ